MNANEFLTQLKDRTKETNIWEKDEKKRSFLEIYKTDEPAYTELINKNIIHKIVADAGLEPQHEYFRIDVIGWEGRYKEITEEDAKAVMLNRHFWDLKIAIEHENSKWDWMDEVVKLVHIRCPLKVIIAYNYCDMRGQEELDKLNFISTWMQKVEAFDSVRKEEYLIIIGNGAAKNDKSVQYDKFDYRGYLFDYSSGCFLPCE